MLFLEFDDLFQNVNTFEVYLVGEFLITFIVFLVEFEVFDYQGQDLFAVLEYFMIYLFLLVIRNLFVSTAQLVLLFLQQINK